MKKNIQYCSVIIMLLTCSCSGINKAVKGVWSIDKMEYKSKDLLYDIGANMIIFESKDCTLPTYLENLKINSKRQGTWEVSKEEDQYFLTIRTGNEIFLGKHKICFKKDHKNKLIKMIINSENLFVECHKGLFNFDKNNHSIDDYLCNDEEMLQAKQ